MASATEQAINRLDAAIQGLEFAVNQRLLQVGAADNLADDIHMLTVDRARLAESLDQSLARAARLENANRNASRLVAAAIGAIRGMLSANAERR
jgi:hypothetical protein